MKLLYITNGINGSGGLERVLSVKASYLAEKLGYEVHILGLNNSVTDLFYEFSSKIVFHQIEVSGNPIAYLKKYVSGIKKCANHIQPDCVIVCDDGLKGFFTPLFLGKSRPIVYERHVSKNIEMKEDSALFATIASRLKLKLMDVLASNFDTFVVLTHENKREWKGKNVIVISNPLSFYPEISSTLNQKRVLVVGKQSYQKGFDLLLRAWKLIHEKQPDWTLDVYGKKDASLGFETLADELGIAHSIRFFDPEKNIVEKYLDSSIYILSSRFEGFGMVLIEAMACGVPCVSFNCPYGPSDIIKDNEDGYLVENGNSEQLAEKCLILMNNDELRMQMGRRAKENVKRYLPGNIMKQWDELFKSIIK